MVAGTAARMAGHLVVTRGASSAAHLVVVMVVHSVAYSVARLVDLKDA